MTSLPPTFEPSGAQALSWLRDPVRPGLPAFLPAMQAAEALSAWGRGGEAREAFEARALAGDSAAARGLAFVHDVAIELGARAFLAQGHPRADTRRRLLEAVEALPSPRPAERAWGSEDVAPVVAVGRRHCLPERLRASGQAQHGLARDRLRTERARLAAIARLEADVRQGDPRLEQVLDRVASVLDFPLLVVSVVHGTETVHRAFRSRLPGVDVPRTVPREASFCTHCVADEAPLIIADALADPFFRNHPAVATFGLVAYFGVPLRMPPRDPAHLQLEERDAGDGRGEVVGTLCGYDLRPRDLRLEDVAVLEIFARRCGEILAGGQESSPHLDAASSAEAGVDVYSPAFFADLADVVRMAVTSPGLAPRAAALLVGPALDRVPDAGWGGLAGRLPDGRAAWLVSGPDVGTRAGAAAAALRGRIGAPVALAMLQAGSAVGSVGAWASLAV